jgi:hypothetical protein
MRSLPPALVLLALTAAASRAGELSIQRVWPQWRDSVAFQSLYEDRTGREIVGNWTVLRSRPDKRGGLYFLTRIENHASPVRAASIVVHVISPDSTDERVFTFPADVPQGGRLFELGLTGADWAGPKVEPVAWLVELRGPDGALLARKASFLWELPHGAGAG